VAIRLPLFPLGTVLVPGLVLPLHVFEPRYRILIQSLMDLPEGAPRLFGVIAARVGQSAASVAEMYDVGCTAQLREVTPYEDGRFDIVAVGQTRFRLRGLDEDAGTPYLTGLVELMGEPDGETDLSDVAELVALRFAALLPLSERQELLATLTTADRLLTELGLLRREIGLVDAFGALPAVDLLRDPPTPN
jgi:uncharacterized protein